MNPSTQWSIEEVHALRVAFEKDPFVSTASLRALLPNRTLKAIWAKRQMMDIKRSPGFRRLHPAWEAIAKMLEDGPKTRRSIQEAMGCTDANVRGILTRMKGYWHIADWEHTSPVIGLGEGPDAPYPFSHESKKERMKRYRDTYNAKRSAKGSAIASIGVHRDPLTAALFGARDVSTDALATLPSHVYRQSMSIDEEELAA